jgi:hypothetical protein
VERNRAARSPHPFGAGDHLTDLAMNGYAPFPFMPRIVTKKASGPRPADPSTFSRRVQRWRGRCPSRPSTEPHAD